METILKKLHLHSALDSLNNRSCQIQQNYSSLLNQLITLNSKHRIKEEKEKHINNLNSLISNNSSITNIHDYITLIQTEIQNLDNSISKNDSQLERLDLCQFIIDNILKNKDISVNKSIEYEYVCKSNKQKSQKHFSSGKSFTRTKNSSVDKVKKIPQQQKTNKNKQKEEKFEAEILKKEVEEMFNESIYEHNLSKQNGNCQLQLNLPKDITDSFINKFLQKKGIHFMKTEDLSKNDNEYNNKVLSTNTKDSKRKYAFKPKNRTISSLQKNNKKQIELSPAKGIRNLKENNEFKQDDLNNVMKKSFSQNINIKQSEVPKLSNTKSESSKSLCSEIKNPMYKLFDENKNGTNDRKYNTLRLFSRTSSIKYINEE